MNIVYIILLSIFVVCFVVASIITGKLSIKQILLAYFKNYYPGAINEKDRKFNCALFVCLGVVPYAVGVFFYLGFKSFVLTFDLGLLCQIDIILLTIFCLFIGMDYTNSSKSRIREELVATLLVNIAFVLLSVFVLLFAGTINSKETISQQDSIIRDVLFSMFYALNFKMISLFFSSLKRIFILNKNKQEN